MTLRKLIIAGQEYFFSLSITTIGAASTLFLFPWVINMHEPFTAIYSGIMCISIFIQIVLLYYWKRRRTSKKSPTTSEEAEPH
jgi:hypothetical protein